MSNKLVTTVSRSNRKINNRNFTGKKKIKNQSFMSMLAALSCVHILPGAATLLERKD